PDLRSGARSHGREGDLVTGAARGPRAPVAQLDSASPSEGEGCPFEPGREHHFNADDESGIRTAMMCAERAALAGDVPIGALLHVDGWMFEGWNEKEARPD